jgi:signal peptidase I
MKRRKKTDRAAARAQIPAPAPPAPPSAAVPRKSTAREYAESLLIAVVLAFFIRTWVVQAFKIPTGSMEHNLLIGDHLLVNKFVFSPAAAAVERLLLPNRVVDRGDIVVFKYPEAPDRDFIKRIIGLPGESLEVRDKTVIIDGAPLDEPYLPEWMTRLTAGAYAIDGRDNHGPVAIPEGHYFVMGDNRDNSEDSRYWGTLPHDHLKGKAVLVYWSYDAERPELMTRTGVGATVRRLASVFTHFFTRTRWSRMFSPVE